MIVYFARERSKFKPLNHGLQSAASGGNCRSGHQCCLDVFIIIIIIIIIIITIISLFSVIGVKTRKVSQGGPRDAAVNLDRRLSVEFYDGIVRAVYLPQHGFLVDLCLQTADMLHYLSKVSSTRKNQSADKHIT